MAKLGHGREINLSLKTVIWLPWHQMRGNIKFAPNDNTPTIINTNPLHLAPIRFHSESTIAVALATALRICELIENLFFRSEELLIDDTSSLGSATAIRTGVSIQCFSSVES